jgi:hypothetical protein
LHRISIRSSRWHELSWLALVALLLLAAVIAAQFWYSLAYASLAMIALVAWRRDRPVLGDLLLYQHGEFECSAMGRQPIAITQSRQWLGIVELSCAHGTLRVYPDALSDLDRSALRAWLRIAVQVAPQVKEPRT